jgi:hypothetical protein
MDFVTTAEKKIDDILEKLFGDKDPELKHITKLSMLKDLYGDLIDEKINNTLETLKQCNEKEINSIKDELKCTLNKDGNVIIIEK